ncbi:MbeD/MobD family mobilization/exclusion protein [Pseudomonas aeruginosa]
MLGFFIYAGGALRCGARGPLERPYLHPFLAQPSRWALSFQEVQMEHSVTESQQALAERVEKLEQQVERLMTWVAEREAAMARGMAAHKMYQEHMLKVLRG